MRIYATTKDGEIVIAKSRGYYGVHSGVKYGVSSIVARSYSSNIANTCLDIIEEEGLEYILAGGDDHEAVINNMGGKVFTASGNKQYVGWAYWLKKITGRKALEFESAVIQYPHYTIFRWMDLYDLLVTEGKDGFVQQKDVKKSKGTAGGKVSSLSPLEKKIVGHVLLYSARIVKLNSMLDPTKDDLQEMALYADVNPFNCDVIQEQIKKSYYPTMRRIKELAVGKKSYSEVINVFNI